MTAWAVPGFLNLTDEAHGLGKQRVQLPDIEQSAGRAERPAGPRFLSNSGNRGASRLMWREAYLPSPLVLIVKRNVLSSIDDAAGRFSAVADRRRHTISNFSMPMLQTPQGDLFSTFFFAGDPPGTISSFGTVFASAVNP